MQLRKPSRLSHCLIAYKGDDQRGFKAFPDSSFSYEATSLCQSGSATTHGTSFRDSAVMSNELQRVLRIAILNNDEQPGPEDTKRPASVELPLVFHTQSAVIGPAGLVTSVKTWPDSPC